MPCLIELLETEKQKIHQLHLGTYRVGRHLDSDIFINNTTVSRNHAEIIVQADQIIVKDCQSSNHTYVNNVEVVESQLKDGDLIAFGRAMFRFMINHKSVSEYPSFDDESNLSEDKIQHSIIKKFSNVENLSFLENTFTEEATISSQDQKNNIEVESKIVKKLTLLLEISQKLCSPQDPDKMLKTILDLIFKVIDIDRGAILLIEEFSQELVCRATKLADGIKNTKYIYSRNIVNLVRQTGEILLVNNALMDARLQKANSIAASSIHASICVPLIANHNTIGVLYIDNLSMTSIYSDEDVKFLAGIAAISATAIQMANTYQKREQALKNQIAELKIKIDPEKRKAEVNEVMDNLNLEIFQKIAEKWKNNDI